MTIALAISVVTCLSISEFIPDSLGFFEDVFVFKLQFLNSHLIKTKDEI